MRLEVGRPCRWRVELAALGVSEIFDEEHGDFVPPASTRIESGKDARGPHPRPRFFAAPLPLHACAHGRKKLGPRPIWHVPLLAGSGSGGRFFLRGADRLRESCGLRAAPSMNSEWAAAGPMPLPPQCRPKPSRSSGPRRLGPAAAETRSAFMRYRVPRP